MNKLDDCYVISGNIINKYIELLYLPMYTISNNMKQDKINEIKTLVREEYKIIRSMSSIEIKLCLETIESNIDKYDTAVIARIKNRIEDYKEVLEGNYITTSELGIGNIPQDREFSSYEIILSIINIETIKRMKNKIYDLTPTCNNDKNFTSSLKKQLEISRITFVFSNSTSELIALYNSIDIDKIPNIDINKLKNNIRRNINLNNVITSISTIYTKKILDILSNMQKVDNNPNAVFDYLTLITRLEVLISYMDKNTLNVIYNYCKGATNDNNKYNMTYVKKLIKRKIDNES